MRDPDDDVLYTILRTGAGKDRPLVGPHMTKPLHHARARDTSVKTAEEPSPGGVLSAAVLVERFEAKVAGGGVFLTLFGIGVRKEGAPLEHTPAFTAYLSGANASDLSKVLTSAVAALRVPGVDRSNPQ